MIYRATVTHLKPHYWSAHIDFFLDPARVERDIAAAVQENDWFLKRELLLYRAEAPGFVTHSSVSDYDPSYLFDPDVRQSLRKRGLWRKLENLAVGQELTVYYHRYH